MSVLGLVPGDVAWEVLHRLGWRAPTEQTAAPFSVEPWIDAGVAGVIGALRVPAAAPEECPVVLAVRGAVVTAASRSSRGGRGAAGDGPDQRIN